MKSFEDEEWARTKALLRKGLTAPRLEHPDFVNSRVLEEIERVPMRKYPALLPLRWLAWSGAAAIFCAGLLTMLFLPLETGRRSDSEFNFPSRLGTRGDAAALCLRISHSERARRRDLD